MKYIIDSFAQKNFSESEQSKHLLEKVVIALKNNKNE